MPGQGTSQNPPACQCQVGDDLLVTMVQSKHQAWGAQCGAEQLGHMRRSVAGSIPWSSLCRAAERGLNFYSGAVCASCSVQQPQRGVSIYKAPVTSSHCSREAKRLLGREEERAKHRSRLPQPWLPASSGTLQGGKANSTVMSVTAHLLPWSSTERAVRCWEHSSSPPRCLLIVEKAKRTKKCFFPLAIYKIASINTLQSPCRPSDRSFKGF